MHIQGLDTQTRSHTVTSFCWAARTAWMHTIPPTALQGESSQPHTPAQWAEPTPITLHLLEPEDTGGHYHASAGTW